MRISDWSSDVCSSDLQNGVQGKGGMPETFKCADNSPRKLRVTTFCGLVCGSLHDDVPPFDEYRGEEVASRLERGLNRPVEVIGRFTQALPNNWKLYAENVRDTYHASLLHTFFTTFGITRLTQEGGVFISEGGGHHASASYSRVLDGAESAYSPQARSEERRVGKEGGSTCRCRWSPYH